MKKNNMIKSAIGAFVIATMSFSVQALQMYDSPMTQQIKGFMPYIPSVGPYVYRDNNLYFASENGNVKVQLKVGDKLSVPTSLQETAYNEYYKWADKDSVGSTGNSSDIEDKEQINLEFQWYRVALGAQTIEPGVNATLLTDQDGVLPASDDNAGPTYTITKKDVGYQIGFRIQAWSERGVPKDGVYLDVPNVAYLGKQSEPTDPSLPPVTVPPSTDPTDPEGQHPDIKDKPVTIDNEFIVRIRDITNGEENAPEIGENDPVYVTHQYKAFVEKYDPVTDSWVDKTEEYKEFITWNIYKDNVAVYEYLTVNGEINNIPTDPVAFANFDPVKTPFTYVSDNIGENDIANTFIKGDNTVFAVQTTNENALLATKTLEPNFSEQGLTLKVRLLVD